MEDVGYISLIGGLDSVVTELEAGIHYAEEQMEKIFLNKYIRIGKRCGELYEL